MGIERGRGRGCPTTNAKVMEEMRRLQATLEAIEMERQRDPDARNVSAPEDENHEGEGVPLRNS